MAGKKVRGRQLVPSVTITTLAKTFPRQPGTRAWAIDKSSKIVFNMIDPTPRCDAKLALLVHDHQAVHALRVLSPSLRVHPDPKVGEEADNVFGAAKHQTWVGYRIKHPGLPRDWPTSVKTRFVLRPFHPNRKHVQLIPVVFAFAADPNGNDFAKHFLLGISVCSGPDLLHVEARVDFVVPA